MATAYTDNSEAARIKNKLLLEHHDIDYNSLLISQLHSFKQNAFESAFLGKLLSCAEHYDLLQ